MADFVTSLFEIAQSALTGTAGLLTSGAKSMTDVFWNATASSPTILGVALGIGVGVGAIYFLFRLIKGWLARAKG